MGYSPPYYLRLRIFAKAVSYFYYHLRQLDPIFDNCPVRCLTRFRDKQNGCPECSYTILKKKCKDTYYKTLEKDLRILLEESGIERGEAITQASALAKSDWTFEELEDDYRALSELEALAGVETEEHPGGYNPDWNIRTYLAICIIREERYKVRRAIAKKREEELEARLRQQRRG